MHVDEILTARSGHAMNWMNLVRHDVCGREGIGKGKPYDVDEVLTARSGHAMNWINLVRHDVCAARTRRIWQRKLCPVQST
ncbi:hypothetical protein QLX08_002223 [Tetragonisca angustula]|uniref:Uncharacterized protein n=1 Tax=Tetragonisca angustula TaxID=166442 RepID=A0AAW1AE50_9HYME